MNVSHKYIKKKHVFRLLIWYKNPWQKNIFKINIRWLFPTLQKNPCCLLLNLVRKQGPLIKALAVTIYSDYWIKFLIFKLVVTNWDVLLTYSFISYLLVKTNFFSPSWIKIRYCIQADNSRETSMTL